MCGGGLVGDDETLSELCDGILKALPAEARARSSIKDYRDPCSPEFAAPRGR